MDPGAGQGEGAGPDYYSVLGCPASATEDQLRAEYRARARQLHPDSGGDTQDFQKLQEAKETLLNRATRKLYDKWKSSGIDVSYKQWETWKDSVQTSLHWATPKHERMLPEGADSQEASTGPHQAGGGAEQEEPRPSTPPQERRGPLLRQDSCHHTIVMINKQEDLRKKFRNYEI